MGRSFTSVGETEPPISELVVLMSGASPVTSTISWAPPGFRVLFRVRAWPTATVTPFCCTVAKLAASNLTL